MADFVAETFALSVPSGWRDATLYTVLAPQTDDFHPSVVIQRRPAGVNDQSVALADQALGVMQSALAKFKLVGRKDVLVLDHAAHVIQYTWEDGSKRALMQWQTFVVIGRSAFILTATCLTAQADNSGPLLIDVMKSFRPMEKELDKKIPPVG